MIVFFTQLKSIYNHMTRFPYSLKKFKVKFSKVHDLIFSLKQVFNNGVNVFLNVPEDCSTKLRQCERSCVHHNDLVITGGITNNLFLLNEKCQVVNFAEFHFKCFQLIRKSSHMIINRFQLCKKNNHFERPYPTLF